MKIVCLGDSLTFGYQMLLKKKWHVIVEEKTGIKMVNRGVNGDTTDRMISRFKKDVIDARPDKMFLMAGYNDVSFNSTWEDTTKNMKMMVEGSRGQNIVPIVAIPPPILLPVLFREKDEGIDFEKSYLMIEDYCQWLREFVVDSKISTLNFRESIDWTDRELYMDGIHQSAKGHQLVAEEVIRFFLEL